MTPTKGWNVVSETRLFLVAAFMLMLTGCSVQDRFLYYPDLYDRSVVDRLSERGSLLPWPGVDGYRGFLLSESLGAEKGTLVVFHGNAGSAADRIYYKDFLLPLGFRIVLLEYPGYGARGGKPGEAAMIADGAESLRLIREQFGGPLYILGESLGAAVAAGAVATAGIPVDGLVLCTPWDDLATVAKTLYPFLPVAALIHDRYDSVGYLKRYDGPLAVIVAERDELIPRLSSERLYNAYAGPKKLWTVSGNHNSWLVQTSPRWWGEVFDFLRDGSRE